MCAQADGSKEVCPRTVGPMIRGGAEQVQNAVNTECLQLLRLLWNVHEDCHLVLHRLRLMVTQARRMSWDVSNGQFQPHQLQLLGQQVKWTCDSVANGLSQFLALSQFQSHCKLILFSKIRQAKEVVSQDRQSILFHTSSLIEVCVHLLSTSPEFPSSSEERENTDEAEPEVKENLACAAQLLQLAQHYNSCLEAIWRWPVQASFILSKTLANKVALEQGLRGTRHKGKVEELLNGVKIVSQVDRVNNNDSPMLRHSLKAHSCIRLLETLGRKRALIHSGSLSVIVSQAWFSPSSDKGTALPPHQIVALGGKIRADGERAVNALKQISSLMPRVKAANAPVAPKLIQYFRQILWSLLGEISSDSLLWTWRSNQVPLVLSATQLLLTKLNLSTCSVTNAEGLEQEDVKNALESLRGALRSFCQVSQWDQNMMASGAVAHRLKRPEQVLLATSLSSAEWSSSIGRQFGDLAQTCIQALDSRGGDHLGTWDDANGLDAKLNDEAAVLFRLDATLAYFNNWMVRRAKGWLNAWAIRQFVACSQRDSALLVASVQGNKMALRTNESALNSPNSLIRLAALHRQLCSEDLTSTVVKLSSMPDDLVTAVGPVAQTLSLAILQSYMPTAAHWRRVGPTSGLDPDKPSPYVRLFIERVMEPVILAIVEFVRGPVQESMAKQVVQAACEAWLEFILEKQIHFSEWGAVQLLRDFMSIREWIRSETELDAEARKNVLQLEILKRCEGVAYLLLRSPGDVLGVGRPSRKSRRVAPSDSVESSPSVSTNSITEDDIPPEMYVPNQQMWLDLRLRPSFLSSCCES